MEEEEEKVEERRFSLCHLHTAALTHHGENGLCNAAGELLLSLCVTFCVTLRGNFLLSHSVPRSVRLLRMYVTLGPTLTARRRQPFVFSF